MKIIKEYEHVPCMPDRSGKQTAHFREKSTNLVITQVLLLLQPLNACDEPTIGRNQPEFPFELLQEIGQNIQYNAVIISALIYLHVDPS